MNRNWLEWIVLVVSIVAVVGIVGFLIVDGLTDAGMPPKPSVTLRAEEAYDSEDGWLVPATVTNDGDMAAEAVVLRATAEVSGSEEESEIAIDYLPAGSDVEVTFGFSGEPAGEVTVVTVGFRLP